MTRSRWPLDDLIPRNIETYSGFIVFESLNRELTDSFLGRCTIHGFDTTLFKIEECICDRSQSRSHLRSRKGLLPSSRAQVACYIYLFRG